MKKSTRKACLSNRTIPANGLSRRMITSRNTSGRRASPIPSRLVSLRLPRPQLNLAGNCGKCQLTQGILYNRNKTVIPEF
jgi:hypothetical protein